MSADLGDEIDNFVSGVAADPPPKRGRRRVNAEAAPKPLLPTIIDEDDEDDEEDEEPAAALPKELPTPEKGVQTLETLIAKFQIGEDPDYKLQLHRVLPKYFAGGIQAHGYLDEFTSPITQDFIASEYGGGEYSVRVFGPDPTRPGNSQRPYGSVKVVIGGPPNPSRLSRSAQAKIDAAGTSTPAPTQSFMMPPAENPELAKQAMKMADDQVKREREDRQAIEKKIDAEREAARRALDPVIEAERRRAEDLLRSERERSDQSMKFMEEKLRESQASMTRLEERIREMSSAPQTSMADELSKIMPLLKGDEDKIANTHATITQSILERHRQELETMGKQQQSLIESMRTSHASEIAAMRDAHRREVEAERESARHRESRHEEVLKAEREERRRDAAIAQKMAEDRDQSWRDRLEQQQMNLQSMWESRVETQKSTYEAQLQWLRSENEQLQTRLRNLEAQLVDKGDVLSQLSKMRDLKQVAKDALGLDDVSHASAGGAGIGLSGSGAESGGKGMADVVGDAIQNLPDILAALSQLSGGGGAQAAQMQAQAAQAQMAQAQAAQAQMQYQPGQIIQTPQGPMVVVQDPRTGQLAMTPKAQFDAVNRSHVSRRPSTALPSQRRGMFAPPKTSDIPVPDLSVGLNQPPQGEQPATPQAADSDKATVATRGRTSKPQKGPNMDKMKQMIADQVARLVHASVTGGDEPEEFVQKIISAGHPPLIIKAITDMPDDEILLAIQHVQPQSAGATPAGQRFIRDAMKLLREATSQP